MDIDFLIKIVKKLNKIQPDTRLGIEIINSYIQSIHEKINKPETDVQFKNHFHSIMSILYYWRGMSKIKEKLGDRLMPYINTALRANLTNELKEIFGISKNKTIQPKEISSEKVPKQEPTNESIVKAVFEPVSQTKHIKKTVTKKVRFMDEYIWERECRQKIAMLP